MKQILNYFFPKKTKWIDIYMYDRNGHYKLIQMRYTLDNNKKEFRTVDVGFVNDFTVKLKIYDAVLSNNLENN